VGDPDESHELMSGRPDQYPALMSSAIFSPAMMVVSMVLALTTLGMIEASTMRKPATPITRALLSTTASR